MREADQQPEPYVSFRRSEEYQVCDVPGCRAKPAGAAYDEILRFAQDDTLGRCGSAHSDDTMMEGVARGGARRNGEYNCRKVVLSPA